MRRGIATVLLALAELVVAYVGMVALGALAGGWSLDTLADQALGLSVHAAVVFVRGLGPVAVLTALGAWGLGRRRGASPGLPAVAGIATAASLVVVPGLLARPLGDWPHLQIPGPAEWVTTVALLAAASTAAWHLAGRRARRRVASAAPAS